MKFSSDYREPEYTPWDQYRRSRNGLLSKLSPDNFARIADQFFDKLNSFLDAHTDDLGDFIDAAHAEVDLPALTLRSFIAEEALRMHEICVCSRNHCGTVCGLIYLALDGRVHLRGYAESLCREVCAVCVRHLPEANRPLMPPSHYDGRDREEWISRTRQRTIGNMHFISQLYVHGLLPFMMLNYVVTTVLHKRNIADLVEDHISYCSTMLSAVMTSCRFDVGEFAPTRQFLEAFDAITYDAWPANFTKKSFFEALIFNSARTGYLPEGHQPKHTDDTLAFALSEQIVVAALLDADSDFGKLGIDITSLIARCLRSFGPKRGWLKVIDYCDISKMRLRLRFNRNFFAEPLVEKDSQ